MTDNVAWTCSFASGGVVHISAAAWIAGECCRVGDTFKLGQSTRLYLLGGPEQMMPEEGLSREQRKQLRIMQVMMSATAA